MSKQKTMIRLGVPNNKNRSKAIKLASRFAGVNSLAISGDAKDQLEVGGESIDISSLINCLCKKVCRADIIVVEEVKDKEEEKKKEAVAKEDKEAEEEKKAKEELKKLYEACPPPYSRDYYHGPMPPPTQQWLLQEGLSDEGCHIM